MLAQFLEIFFKSLKLDRSLYKENKYFGEAAIYFAGLVMILDGVAGAVAANSIIKTSVGISGLTALLTWFVWAIFIFVIGVKIFPDKGSKVPFKKVLIAVGYAHAPGLIRFFAVTPDLVLPIIFLTQFWIFASLIIALTYLGAEDAQLFMQIPAAVGFVFQGLVLFYLLGAELLVNFKIVFRKSI